MHNHIRFGLFYLSKPQGTEVLQYYRARTEAFTLKRLLRRLDTASVCEPREKLGLQFRCSFADYGERFRSPTATAR